MEWKILSKLDASAITNTWQQMDRDTFNDMVADWPKRIEVEMPKEYEPLRTEVIKAYENSKIKVRDNVDYRKKKEYFTDLFFALDFYEIMKKYNFSVRMASNDQVWMYLCVKIFPDIIHDRYRGTKVKFENSIIERNVNEERFWKTRRRIYLKVIWWYIYLSMQVDEKGQDDLIATFNILEDNSTDEIVQIVERSGAAGYRVDVYREIMKFYSANRDKYDNTKFRQVMVLNTAKTQIVEPDLIEGGVQVYVKELFEFVD